MRFQLWMRGQDPMGYGRAYRTITEEEFVAILGYVMERDGKRPWDGTPIDEAEADSAVANKQEQVAVQRRTR